MPVLTAPPPRTSPVRPRPAPAPRSAPALDLPTVSFFGRTLAEYAQFFRLDLEALRGRDVLDVAAGPSSFAAEACARRVHAVAVDPFYGAPEHDLAGRIRADYERMFAQIRAKPRLFRFKTFASFDAAEAERRAAAQRFLADYSTHFAHGRYVGGALPRLPFFDRTFDLVLCAHLLFLHAARFDFAWHVEAARELIRVAADEVRIHPICGPDGRPYPQLDDLRGELDAVGIESEIVPVDYEFFAGSNRMLVLRRRTPC